MRSRRFFPLFLILFILFSCNRPAKKKPIVVILGVDGADWQLIDPLIQQGRLPLFKKLKEQGAWGKLRTTSPAKSPIIWTSIASGKSEAKHGINDFLGPFFTKNGKRLPFLSNNIREPLLWDILTAKSMRSVLVNWYLSSPPQPLLGLNVSDYFRMHAFQPRDTKRGSLADTVFPPARAAEFEKFVDNDYARVLQRMQLPDFPLLFEKRGTGKRYSDFLILENYQEWVLQENLVQEVADHLFRSEEFDLFAAYFKMPDVVQHFAYMSFIDNTVKKQLDSAAANGTFSGELQAEAYAQIADILCPVYQDVEKNISRFTGSEKYKNAYFIIVSDHGFSFFVREGTVRYNHVGPERAPSGILLILGPEVKPGRIRQAKIFDVAPTVLYLLDLPLDRRMDGIPLVRAFDFRRKLRYEVYKKNKPQNLRRDRDMDEKNIQDLKALGYIN